MWADEAMRKTLAEMRPRHGGLEVFWVAAHGDPDVSGNIYWCGYVSARKDHTWDRDLQKAIKFYAEDDVLRSGLGVKPAGIRAVKVINGLPEDIRRPATGQQA